MEMFVLMKRNDSTLYYNFKTNELSELQPECLLPTEEVAVKILWEKQLFGECIVEPIELGVNFSEIHKFVG